MADSKTSPKNPKVSQPKNQHKHRGVLLIGLLGIVIAVTALITAFITFREVSTYKDRVNQSQQSSKAMFAQLKQSQTAFQNIISEKITKNETNLNQLLQQTSNISAESAMLQAKYLIHLAKLNLYFQANVGAALKLLQLAQHQLTNFHTPSIESLKQKLENDIITLAKVPALNKQRLLNELDDIINQVKHIPIIPSALTQPSVQSTTESKHSHPWWDNIKQNLTKLKSFVIISKIDNPQAFAFTPESKMLTKQSILAKLVQAEWAILNSQPKIYKQSLSSAKNMLKTIGMQKANEAELTQKLDKLQIASPSSTTDIVLTSDPTFISPTQNNKTDAEGIN